MASARPVAAVRPARSPQPNAAPGSPVGLFGTFRYVLALMVVAQHLWAPLNNWSGIYAVFGFYVVSGYLMALVLNEVYPYSPSGLARFFVNRGLRIYAPYLIAVAFAGAVAAAYPLAAGKIDPAMVLPSNRDEWLANLAILPLVPEYIPRLVSVAWSLRVELIFYVLMGLLLARHVVLTAVWFGVSLLFTAFAVFVSDPFPVRYYAVEAASLPFSLGALLYFVRPRLGWGFHLPLAAGLFAANAALALLVGRVGRDYGLYLSLFLSAYLVAVLRHPPEGSSPGWLRALDRRLGDLSYPIFLMHWPIGVVAAVAFGHEARPSFGLFLATLPLAHGAGLLLHWLAERPVESLRTWVRGRHGAPTARTPARSGPVPRQALSAPRPPVRGSSPVGRSGAPPVRRAAYR